MLFMLMGVLIVVGCRLEAPNHLRDFVPNLEK